MGASMDEALKPTKYCLKCSYVLDGLPEQRCPECGREFDRNDASTFRKHPKPVKKTYAIILTYLLSGILALVETQLLIVAIDGFLSVEAHLLFALWQGCGVLAWLMVAVMVTDPATIVVCFSVSWAVWLLLVCKTRLRNLSYRTHVILCVLWCLGGIIPAFYGA